MRNLVAVMEGTYLCSMNEEVILLPFYGTISCLSLLQVTAYVQRETRVLFAKMCNVMQFAVLRRG